MLTKSTIMQRLFIVFMLLTFSVVLDAAEISTIAPLTAVTVYPGSAKVTREAQVSLKPGLNKIIINELPVNLNESSLRVKGDAASDVELGNIALTRQIRKDLIQEKERSLQKQIEGLEAQQQSLKDDISRYQLTITFIKKMALSDVAVDAKTDPWLVGGTYLNLPIDKWSTAWQTLENGLAKEQEKIRLANQNLKELNDELDRLSRELQQIAINQRETLSASIEVRAMEPTEAHLSLEYQIKGAGWTPVYDADLDTQKGNIQFKTLAQITQRTGEDWNNVAVTLSTLRPSASTQLPQLNTWVIDFVPDFVAMDKLSTEAAGMSDMALRRRPSPAKRMSKKAMRTRPIEMVSTEFSAAFKVPGLVSLASGSEKKRFSLATTRLKGQVRLASAPRYDPRALLQAEAKYREKVPLLPGKLVLYRDGNFVGSTRLKMIQPGETLKLAFGEDDKVKIKFLPDPDQKRQDGLLFGKKKVVERHYQVSINNFHDKAYPITIMDALPVAAHEDISIKLMGDKPTKRDLAGKKGVVSWERVLPPKQEVLIKYGYSVSYPVDKTVQGL